MSRFAPRSMPSRSSSPSPHLRFTGTIILNHQVRYKSSVRVVRVVVVLFFASTRTLRSSPYKPAYTHFERGRVDPRPRPLRHVFTWIRFIRFEAPPPLVSCTLYLLPLPTLASPPPHADAPTLLIHATPHTTPRFGPPLCRPAPITPPSHAPPTTCVPRPSPPPTT